MNTIIYTGVLVVEECCSCHIMFAIPSDMRERALDNHSIHFHCPEGHPQHFSGPTRATQLRAELDQMQAARDEARRQRNIANMERERVERSNAALRGHLTRYRKRVANGVCPVAGCKRHFLNVQDHVATMHPEWLKQHAEVFDV